MPGSKKRAGLKTWWHADHTIRSLEKGQRRDSASFEAGCSPRNGRPVVINSRSVIWSVRVHADLALGGLPCQKN